MNPERWEEVKALFAHALEMPASERAAWIESRNPDAEVGREALRLVREHELADAGFLGVDTTDGGGLLDRAARVLAASAVEPATPGNVLAGRYEVIRELGSGGSGIVYLAEDRALHNRPVVLKFLFPGGEAQDRLSRRFRQEIEALARIRHPGVVGALDVGQSGDGRVFLVMEYVEGATLRAEMEAPMEPARVAALIGQMAGALAAAHQAGVLHRDLKPENVMLQPEAGGKESVKLIDFGIAKVQYSDPAETAHTVTFVGTINYVAPEQLMGQASEATDVYALGIMAYEMLTGLRPFSPATPFALYELQKSGALTAPSQIRPQISSAADRAILRALSFDPARRQGSPEEFARELSAGLAQKSSRLRRYRVALIPVAALLLSLVSLTRDRWNAHAPASIITTVAGGAGGRLGHVQAIAADPSGSLYFSASSRSQIFRLDAGASPHVTLVAGTGRAGFSGDGGDALQAQLQNPLGLAVGRDGAVYFVDQRNYRIRKVTLKNGTISTVVGTGEPGFAGDGGDPKMAKISAAFGIAFDSQGNLFIGDPGNNRVRMVRFGSKPVITTVAGSGTDGFAGDGGDPLQADLSAPTGLAFDPSGNLYISDEHNNRIRKVIFGLHPTISTVAGMGAGAFSGDGGNPMAAGLSGPQNLATDSAGNLFIADSENHAVRMVTFGPAPAIRTIAGTGVAGFSGDGGAATAARLSLPNGVAISADGDLYIGDGLNDRIRRVTLPAR